MAQLITDCVILYVEDNDATVYLFQMALRERGSMPQLFRVSSGDEAIAYLNNNSPYQDAPKPNLVVLDLNLPGQYKGMEVLAFIRADPRLCTIPAYVFTTSNDPKDRAAAIAAGAHDFLTKGNSLDEFVSAAETICSGLQ